ncbi:hypothetical protein FJY90_01375 [Candidatus Gottesmanbacteria bacterium]|nr:hypothetical protein [Candidatus Gottesmanbacteria bacterium]MBM3712100.1 hypothetical protein [Actinomycetota bacterium]
MVVAIIIIFENLYLTTYTAKHLLKFIIFLFISQIFVNIARYPIVGIAELYIGSISVEGGSITAIFSLIGISFAFSAYIIERKVKYILLIFGFFIFSLIGDKRAQIIISPLIMLIQYFHFINIESKKIYHLVQIIPIIILSSIIVYIGVITIPTLNPENKIYGSFDINYLINFIDDYLFPAYPIKNIQQGRGEAPIAVYNLLTQRGWLYFFFGLGPGDIISSVFTIPSRIIGGEDFIAGIKYGIGYGTRTGLLFTVMQVGVVGLIFYLGIFFRIIQNVYKIYFNINPSINKNRNIILIGLIGALWIFVFDFLFYSKVFIYSMPIMVSILFAYKYLTLSPSYESGFKYGVFNTSR